MKKFAKFLAIALAVCFIIGAVPALAEGGNHIIASGYQNENVRWELDSRGNLTITGTGDMHLAPEGRKVGDGYWNKIKRVYVGEGITEIGYLFITDAELVSLPSTLVKVPERAFWYRDCLKTVIIRGATTIESFAFLECTSLEKVVLPKNLEKIEAEAFHYCKNIKEVYYGGTQKEWAQFVAAGGIDICNYEIRNKIHFNCPGIPGDVNYSGTADAGDATMVLRATVGVGELTEDQLLIADMNASGTLDAGDATLILRDVVGA